MYQSAVNLLSSQLIQHQFCIRYWSAIKYVSGQISKYEVSYLSCIRLAISYVSGQISVTSGQLPSHVSGQI